MLTTEELRGICKIWLSQEVAELASRAKEAFGGNAEHVFLSGQDMARALLAELDKPVTQRMTREALHKLVSDAADNDLDTDLELKITDAILAAFPQPTLTDEERETVEWVRDNHSYPTAAAYIKHLLAIIDRLTGETKP